MSKVRSSPINADDVVDNPARPKIYPFLHDSIIQNTTHDPNVDLSHTNPTILLRVCAGVSP